MRFVTQYDNHDRVFSDSGSREKIIYSPIFDKKGVMSLEPCGKENLYDFIQSHAESVDIHVLLRRYNDGDVSALSRMQGAYGDFTTMPQTFADALNTMISAENTFNSLPVETRAQFGHSFQRFLASFDNPDFVNSFMSSMSAPVNVQDNGHVSSDSGSDVPDNGQSNN